VGFRPLVKSEGFNSLVSAVGSLGECNSVSMNSEDFYLGTLNTMMMNLDELSKYEVLCDNLLKKVEKTYSEVSQGGPLNEKQIESKRLGNVSMYRFLKNFEWDDLKFPRSGDIIQPIKEKLISLEKSLKEKIQDFNDAKNSISMMGEDSTDTSSLYTLNLNDLVLELEESQNVSFENVFGFENILGEPSKYLKNVLVFIPKNENNKFKASYESEDDSVVQGSYQFIGTKKNFAIGRVVIFMEFSGAFESNVKEKFGGVCREFKYDPDLARKRKEMKLASKHNKTRTTSNSHLVLWRPSASRPSRRPWFFVSILRCLRPSSTYQFVSVNPAISLSGSCYKLRPL
jgi:hypothetical protein